jgi:hypothetical protein
MKRFTISLATVAIMATGILADCPTVSTDATGDFLIAPAFFTTGGWDTKLKVINTNTTNSVLLRVVLRDSQCTKEVDFPILLSPSDVWTATMTTNADGKAMIVSKDDSNYVTSIADGIVLPQKNPAAENAFKAGYVEFYPLAQYNEGSDAIVPKATLKKRYEILEQGYDAAVNSGAIDVDNDSVAGFVTLVNNSVAMTVPMTAIESASDEFTYGTAIGSGVDTLAENYFGGEDNTIDVYKLLQKDSVSVPFEKNGDDSQVLFTSWYDMTCPQVRSYDVILRDNSENREVVKCEVSPCPSQQKLTFPNELGIVHPSDVLKSANVYADGKFAEGWIKMSNIRNTKKDQQLLRYETTEDAYVSSVLSTYMQILDTKGSPAFNWMYLPFKYYNSELYIDRECSATTGLLSK